jgi:peptide deformylase
MIDIVLLGEDILRQKSQAFPLEKIDAGLLALFKDMFVALDIGRGIGLAAPQVGRSERFFVVKTDDGKPRVFINPEIIRTSEELTDYEEGCMSIPGVYATVKRPAQISVQAYNEKGRPFVLDADGILARVIQHENDHLNGKLFIDHLGDFKRKRILHQYEKLRKI